MKKIIIAVLVICSSAAFGQLKTDSVRMQLLKAKAFCYDKSKPFYNPVVSFQIYSKLAATGNAEAMNGLALCYSNGLGVTADDQQALSWFEKSAEAGYGNAYYNWGTAVKSGLGTNQDFKKAYNIYEQGAQLNYATSLYGQGYMLFKGLGCTQSYEQAVALFQKASVMQDHGAMYMLGICYRNGYGITLNADSAKYWLSIASAKGYKFATEELAIPQPENANIVNITVLQAPKNAVQGSTPDINNGFQAVKHHFPVNNIDGDYTGYAIKFDWSGKHVINKSTLSLKLSVIGKKLTGNWTEDESASTALDAKLTDTAIIFNNTRYSREDHYNMSAPNDLEFKDARFRVLSSGDTAYITGNLQLYSITHKEPEKPTFIMLVRNDNPIQTDSSINVASNVSNLKSSQTDSVKFIIYPNPFTNTLNAQFILKKSCTVRLMVSNLVDARLVYQGLTQQFDAGEHTISINLDGVPGTYICTLIYGNQLKSAVVFKQ